MAADMKKTIADAARTLLFENKVKKLTVKDIVEYCHITRQTFYYHFEDIPDLLEWVLTQGLEKIMEECLTKENEEEALRYFLAVWINAKPLVEKGLQTNYRDELEKLLPQAMHRFFEQVAQQKHMYENYSQSDLKMVLRYHSYGVMGLLREWTQEDTKQLDHIVHQLYRIIKGEIVP